MTEATLSLKERLHEQIGECLASDLDAHVKRGAVFVVASQLSLLEVALAIAEDKTEPVQAWLESAALRRPSKQQAAEWRQEPSLRFLSVIVQPYVLVQLT